MRAVFGFLSDGVEFHLSFGPFGHVYISDHGFLLSFIFRSCTLARRLGVVGILLRLCLALGITRNRNVVITSCLVQLLCVYVGSSLAFVDWFTLDKLYLVQSSLARHSKFKYT